MLYITSHLGRLGFHSGEGFSPAGNYLFKALGASGAQEEALEATLENAGYLQSPEGVVPVEGIQRSSYRILLDLLVIFREWYLMGGWCVCEVLSN